MTVTSRPLICALVVVALVALGVAAALSAALSLSAESAEVAALAEQSEALRSRESRLLPANGRKAVAAASFEAKTITLAGAALQSRVEAAVLDAKGRLISSKVDVESRGGERGIALAAELTVTETNLQALLYDLETGRPYLFVDSFEARSSDAASESGVMRVSLSLSGQWSASK